ncbi:MAG: hypothetical protein H7329_17265 [Opitutaceae bacterium]|nr:hypothetical protein [Cytophagales bacterium]
MVPNKINIGLNYLTGKHLFKWVSITFLFLVILLISSRILQTKEIAKSYFEKSSQDKIQKIIVKKHRSNNELKESIRLSGFFNFETLVKKGEYQSVFKNGNLIFWGNNIFLPEFQRVKGEFLEKYVELKSGKFLVVKDTLLYKNESFEIVNLVPLFFSYNITNQYIRSGPNSQLFGSNVTDINNYEITKDIFVSGSKGEYLFSIQFSDGLIHETGWLDVFTLIVIAIFLFLLSLYVWQGLFVFHDFLYQKFIKSDFAVLWKKHEYDIILFFIICYALLIRTLLLIFKIPNSIVFIKFFNSQHFNWNRLTPTPGDLMLHMLFLVCGLLAFKNLIKKTSIYAKLNDNSIKYKMLSGVGISFIVALSHFSLFALGTGIYSMFDALKYTLDISEIISIEISFYFLLIYIVLSAGLFIGISRIAFELIDKTFAKGIFKNYLPGLLVFLLFTTYYSPKISIAVGTIHCFFFLLITILKLPSNKHSFDYSALVYYTLGGLSCAFIGTYSLSQLYPKRDLQLKINFITQQLQENNLLGESILNDISRQVATDQYVANGFSNPLFSVKDMEEKVRRFYLGNYLNRYDIQIKVFDDKGNSLNSDDNRTLQQVRSKFPFKLYRTNYPEIYFYITQQNQILKNYLSNVIITDKGLKAGSILIELQTKRFIPNSILPILLVDRKSESFQNTSGYSYAVYNNGELTNSFGNYNFKRDIINKILLDSASFNTNVEIANSNFLVSNLGKGRKIVVQSEVLPKWVFISNMSFLFILIELSILIFFIGNLLLFDFNQFYNSLTFKIQFYTITAFFIPVSLVSGGVLTAVITSYNQELQAHFKDNASNIAYALSEELENYYYRTGNLDRLNEYVLRSARLHNTDVNIYRKSGQLLISSSPVLYESGLVSNFVNPLAYFAIRQEKDKLFLQEERIGSLTFNHVYVQIRSSETGEELGIISIPFFASGKELSARITNALKIIINIATFTFMVFIFFSYAASNFITYPLKLITLRIRKTTLEGDNRPLEWKSKDELGLLIREYNLMLQKLEQNKKSMAISHKEIAWREVAQQVAHEIKNPLTPIKLSLQHLRRVISDGKKTDPEKLDKTISNLITQVETLDGIASSFSVYAKMPSLFLESVNLKKIIEQVVDVYTSEKKVIVEFLFPESEIVIVADERMLGRILANLILNADQAIPVDRKGNIKIQVENQEVNIILKIIDNGSGIPVEVLEKIFEPHFSTKFSGSGIGLFIVKKGIEQMGGSISCASGPEGTVFTLLFKKSI